MLIPPLQQLDMLLLQRVLTKLKEVRDFHMEKAINSSMPKGQSEEGMEGEDVWRYKRRRKVWGSTRITFTILLFRIQSSGAMRIKAERKHEKLVMLDVVLPNVQNQKNPWVLISKNTLERKEKVVGDKQIDERRGKWETAKRKNRNKVKEKEGENLCVEGGEEGEKGRERREIDSRSLLSEWDLPVSAISLDTAATPIPSPLKRLKPLKQVSLVSPPPDRETKTEGVNFPPN